MLKILYLSVIILITTSSCFKERRDNEYKNSLRVVSWNIAQTRYASVDEISSFLDDLNPTLVVLQEASNTEASSIASRLGLKNNPGKVGKSLLYSYRVTADSYDLSPSRWKRTLDLYHTEYFIIASAHLTVEESSRLAQVNEVIDIIRPYLQSPVLLIGDLNFDSGTEYESMLYDVGLRNISGSSPTFPAASPSVKIDYIMTSKEVDFKVHKYDTNLSDHLPVVVDITFKR